MYVETYLVRTISKPAMEKFPSDAPRSKYWSSGASCWMSWKGNVLNITVFEEIVHTYIIIKGNSICFFWWVSKGSSFKNHFCAVIWVGSNAKNTTLSIHRELVKSHRTNEGDVCCLTEIDILHTGPSQQQLFVFYKLSKFVYWESWL